MRVSFPLEADLPLAEKKGSVAVRYRLSCEDESQNRKTTYPPEADLPMADDT